MLVIRFDLLACLICYWEIDGGLNGLTNYSITVHGITISIGGDSYGFECEQNGRWRRFFKFCLCFRNALKHLLS